MSRPGFQVGHLDSSDARKLGRWKNGENCDFYSADRMFTDLGIYEWEIPENLWLDSRTSRSKWSHCRDEGEKMIQLGLSLGFISRDLGVPRTTVGAWKRKMKLAGKIDT